jgi:AraC-like DNA-binding protein
VTLDHAASFRTISWLSDAAQRLQAIVGEELWQQIVQALGGNTIYIPLGSKYYERRNRRILLFARSHTVAETAQHFCLSPRQVKRLLNS